MLATAFTSAQTAFRSLTAGVFPSDVKSDTATTTRPGFTLISSGKASETVAPARTHVTGTSPVTRCGLPTLGSLAVLSATTLAACTTTITSNPDGSVTRDIAPVDGYGFGYLVIGIMELVVLEKIIDSIRVVKLANTKKNQNTSES